MAQMSSASTRPGPVGVWLREVRVPFFTASIIPVLLGASAAWYETGRVHPGLLGLTLLGAVLAHAGANMANDYFDHLSGNDGSNRFRSPFNGGAGLIQEGLLTPGQVNRAALVALGGAALVGIYLAWAVSPWILGPMLLGGFCAYFYTGEPLRLAYYGVGEIFLGLSFGPLLVAGAYLVQTGTVSASAVAASVPVGLLIASVLYINQFPDYEADHAVGKAHWVVRLGTARAVPWLAAMLLLASVWIIGAVAFRVVPWPALLALLPALPLSLKAIRLARRYHASPLELRPANAMVIQAHLLAGLGLVAGYLVAGRLGG